MSDACRAAFAEGREADGRHELKEFFALQDSYLRGVVGKQLHARFKKNDFEDVVMYIAASLIRSLRNDVKLHWHGLWGTYKNCMTDYGRRQDVKVDTPGFAPGGFNAHAGADELVHADADRDDPALAADRTSVVARLHEMLAALADGPDGIRHPERMLKVLNFHMADIDNNAEIARALDIPPGTLRREWGEFCDWASGAFPDLRDFIVDAGDTADPDDDTDNDDHDDAWEA